MRIGIDLGGTKIEGIALADTGAQLLRQRVDAPRGDYHQTISAVRALVARLETKLGQRGTVGVGIPGAISATSGLIKNANSTWLIGNPLDQDLAAALERPVRVANDANCFAISEATDGAGRDAAVVFGVIIGTGTGAGIAVDRHILTGANAIAGEWGHNPLPWPQHDEMPGSSCYCGKRGCIETWLSGPGLTRDFAQHGGRELDPPDIVTLAEQGDAKAESALQRYEDRMARALANVINVLDPDVVVLGGGMSNITRLYPNVPRRWARYIFSDEVCTQLRAPAHGDSSGVRGAAWLWPATSAPPPVV
ncbi:MAG: ROK family protein [Pseudomonadota bacterium]|nr:MAG: ROK family protein [Pseudomonadota bacterium]